MTEPGRIEPCDYYREVHRISAQLTDFDPNHSFSAVSDHVEALLKRFGAIAATPDAPSDPTPEPIGMDDPDGILLGAYRKAVMDAWLSGSIQTRNHRNALFSQIVGRMRRARSPNTPTPDTKP